MGRQAGALANIACALATLLALSAPGADLPPVFADASSDGLSARAPNMSGEVGGVSREGAPGLRVARLDFERLELLRDKAVEGRPSRTRLNLFESAEFDWTVVRSAATATGYSLSGPLSGVEGGTATLVVNGGMAVGSAWTPDGAYRIRTVGRTQVVERVELSRSLACPGPLAARAAARPERGARTASSVPEDDGSEIDVLVVYTPAARRQAGGHRAMLAEIDHDVAWTNEAYAVSDVIHRVRLVGAAEVDYDEQERGDDIRRIIRDGDGHMDEVHELRDSLAADVVVLWTTNGGLAILLTLLDGSESVHAFATVHVGGLTTFAHELGHLMGVDHEREDSNGNLPFPYSHGYVLRGLGRGEYAKLSTIMQSGGGNLPRFSNPRQRFRGVPLGVHGDEPTASVDGPADAARSMNETRRVVANYRRSATRCSYQLSAPSEAPSAGGAFTLRVEADAGCRWTVRSADGFTTVESGAKGTGDGAATYRVPANDGWLREPALAVAGRMHVAVQPGTRPVKPVCERSAKVREFIEAELKAHCADIAAADLARVTTLVFDGKDLVQPVPGDFDGLSNLSHLRLKVRKGGSLPVGVFDGLASLATLDVLGDEDEFSVRPGSFRGLRNLHRLLASFSDVLPQQGMFEGMPRLHRLIYYGGDPIAPGTFEGLSSLRQLSLNGEIAHLPAGALRGLPNLRRLDVSAGARDGTAPTTVEPGLFDGLPNLELLELHDLAEVPLGLFEGLSGLHDLRLQYNAFTSLPPAIFEGLSSLVFLYLDNDAPGTIISHRQVLSTLPTGLFAGLPSVEVLHLANVGLRELRPGAFRDLGTTLTHLYLRDNELTVLDAGTFDGLEKLVQLDLSHNDLTSLPRGVFDGLGQSLLGLSDLRLNHNRLTTLHPDALAGLPNLFSLRLQGNVLASLPSDAFQSMRWLGILRLDNNRLTTLPLGLFAGVATDTFVNSVQYGARHGLWRLTLHGNPGAPFALSVNPMVASQPWRRPLQVAARIATGVPFPVVASFNAADGQLEPGAVRLAAGATLSDPLAIRPSGREPAVVRIAGFPDLPGGEECAAHLDAGRLCAGGPSFTGVVLEAGPPLVLNGVAEQRQFDEPAEIDLANVFLEFDDSAIPAFSVRSSDPSVATADLSRATLTIAPANSGTATITITATAPNGATATRAFSVTVPTQRAFLHGWRLTLLDDEEDAQEAPGRPTHGLPHKEHPSPHETARGSRHAE